jgi:hypothetical protein
VRSALLARSAYGILLRNKGLNAEDFGTDYEHSGIITPMRLPLRFDRLRLESFRATLTTIAPRRSFFVLLLGMALNEPRYGEMT